MDNNDDIRTAGSGESAKPAEVTGLANCGLETALCQAMAGKDKPEQTLVLVGATRKAMQQFPAALAKSFGAMAEVLDEAEGWAKGGPLPAKFVRYREQIEADVDMYEEWFSHDTVELDEFASVVMGWVAGGDESPDRMARTLRVCLEGSFIGGSSKVATFRAVAESVDEAAAEQGQ